MFFIKSGNIKINCGSCIKVYLHVSYQYQRGQQGFLIFRIAMHYIRHLLSFHVVRYFGSIAMCP